MDVRLARSRRTASATGERAQQAPRSTDTQGQYQVSLQRKSEGRRAGSHLRSAVCLRAWADSRKKRCAGSSSNHHRSPTIIRCRPHAFRCPARNGAEASCQATPSHHAFRSATDVHPLLAPLESMQAARPAVISRRRLGSRGVDAGNVGKSRRSTRSILRTSRGGGSQVFLELLRRGRMISGAPRQARRTRPRSQPEPPCALASLIRRAGSSGEDRKARPRSLATLAPALLQTEQHWPIQPCLTREFAPKPARGARTRCQADRPAPRVGVARDSAAMHPKVPGLVRKVEARSRRTALVGIEDNHASFARARERIDLSRRTFETRDDDACALDGPRQILIGTSLTGPTGRQLSARARRPRAFRREMLGTVSRSDNPSSTLRDEHGEESPMREHSRSDGDRRRGTATKTIIPRRETPRPERRRKARLKAADVR